MYLVVKPKQWQGDSDVDNGSGGKGSVLALAKYSMVEKGINGNVVRDLPLAVRIVKSFCVCTQTSKTANKSRWCL